MLRTMLLAGAAVLIGGPAALADAGSNYQPYMSQHPAFGAQGQPSALSQADNANVTSDPADARKPEGERSMRRHMANRPNWMMQRRMASAGRGEPVGQTWNSPSDSMYYRNNQPYAWGYAPGPGYGYGPGYGSGGYYGPSVASAPYSGGLGEGRAAYEGPSAWDPDYPEVGPPVGQTMSNPPSGSMYFYNTGPY